jgi:cbb3-type cytochrome oxidase subunit 1
MSSVLSTVEALRDSGIVGITHLCELTLGEIRDQIASSVTLLQLRPLYHIIRQLWNVVQEAQLQMHRDLFERTCKTFSEMWNSGISGAGAMVCESRTDEMIADGPGCVSIDDVHRRASIVLDTSRRV